MYKKIARSKAFQLMTLAVLSGSSSLSHAEISGSGHQILGCTGVIQSHIWHDANRNGIQDAGEVPLTDVALKIQRASEPELGVDTLVTGGNGRIRFFNLCLEDHLLWVDAASLPPGMLPTAVNVSSEQRDVFDSDGQLDFEAVLIRLNVHHDQEETVDFGFARALCDGAIGDRVWLDEDSNGVQDAVEPGLAGITLTLTDLSTAATERTVSDEYGGYRFDGLCSGDYQVRASDLPASFSPSPANAGGDSDQDSHDQNSVIELEGRDNSIDFGVYRAGCTSVISGALYRDTNGNGSRQPHEPPLVAARLSVESGDGHVQMMRSDEAGNFRLSGLCAGAYAVALDTATIPTDAYSTGPNEWPLAVNLATSNEQLELAESGFSTACTAAIGDSAWLDLDGNGRQDTGEPGLSDVMIELRDAVGNVLGERRTASDGTYSFDGLCAGDYAVQVDALALDGSLTPTQANVGSAGQDSDGTEPVWITLASNDQRDDSIDFGFLPDDCSLRMSTQCTALSFESVEFKCEKPINTLGMVWRGARRVDVVAYLGDDHEPVLEQLHDIQPGQRVEINGYADAPKEVLWRVFDHATGQLVGDSWFNVECKDKQMDGAEDCGLPQGDGDDADACADGQCVTDWGLDSLVDKKGRLRCTSIANAPVDECAVVEDGTVHLRHTLLNSGRYDATALDLSADHGDVDDDLSDVSLAPGEALHFVSLETIGSTQRFSIDASGTAGGTHCATSRTTTVSAAPKPDCAIEGLSRLELDDDKVKWKLRNVGARNAVIDRVSVEWPVANGVLKEVKRGGDKIVETPTLPAQAVFPEDALHRDRNKRKIKRDKVETIELKFEEKSPGQTDRDYRISVEFEGGCAVTLEP